MTEMYLNDIREVKRDIVDLKVCIEKIEKNQERMIELMTHQKAMAIEIEGLKVDFERCRDGGEKCKDTVFGRIRELEKTVASETKEIRESTITKSDFKIGVSVILAFTVIVNFVIEAIRR